AWPAARYSGSRRRHNPTGPEQSGLFFVAIDCTPRYYLRMAAEDPFLMALCIWREARGEPQLGWIAVGWVIKNRAAQRKQTVYKVVTARLQFSSMTAPKDPELSLWPDEADATWIAIQAEASGILAGVIPDPTGGAIGYYASTI